jgi:transcription-repair coupling factor (superfamily II helicase)
MAIRNLKDLWSPQTFPGFSQWQQKQAQSVLFSGIAGSADSFLIADIFSARKVPVVVFVPNSKRAEVVMDECGSLVGAENVVQFPSRDAIPYNMKSPFGPTMETRLTTLSQMMAGEQKIYVAPSATLLQRLIQPKKLFNHIIRLHSGDEIDPEQLAQWLVENGFRRESMVENIGTFAIRGGIFDIYPFVTDDPVRLEFWGNTIDSIRLFDIYTQKSKKALSKVELFPVKEFCLQEEHIEHLLSAMHAHCEKNGIDTTALSKLEHSWRSLGDFEGIEWFMHWSDFPTVTLFDYLPQNAMVVWDDVFSPARRAEEDRLNYVHHLDRVPDQLKPLVSPPETLLVPTAEITGNLEFFTQVFVNTVDVPAAEVIPVAMTEQTTVSQTLDPLVAELEAKNREGYSISIVCANLGHAERLTELLADKCPFVKITIGSLDRGFVERQNKRIFYSESQIFNRSARPIKFRKNKSSAPITSFDSLTPGDFVVHVDHGIAQFTGIERIRTGDLHQDCMALQYQGASKLYVPVSDFGKVQKYIAGDSAAPSLSKLGTATWEKLKEKTRQSLQEMAKDLIELYAKRQFLKGIKFAEDSVWQKEFEDAFMYTETADQLLAIKDIKADMEAEKPMDRLVCGDVGFGKTEVAMRAAFKAAMNGFQVAVLAPTTILAAQHYQTFSERMANFPVTVAQLSRFLTAREQKAVLDKVKEGKVDIVIGTHRLFSQDVAFKNLGLLIVDEEQRFGVKHKEKLKQFRFDVDVLSLTATPIPRTLHMSLIGARDLSTINTPPRNRLSVETRVTEQHDEVIRNAVEFELSRGGQVYIVNNRIKNMELMQDHLEMLVPRARVIIAHGQMEEHELGRIMREFIAGRFDVLLSTVIIENGLDIPNVNTIIIYRADTMGLSQLYQLRGRVGRSSEQAYAYFLTPSFKQVNEISLKRLRALEQYTDLGSGFQIAMRDLEIRGAGNILGTSQHGFIAAVGFELYCKLLQEAIGELKGQPQPKKTVEVKVDLPIEAYLPADYVQDGATRISLYQDFSAAQTAHEIDTIKEGLADRFGPLPPPVNALIQLMHIKVLTQRIGASQISLGADGKLSLGFGSDSEQGASSIREIVARGARQFEVLHDEAICLKTALVSRNLTEKMREIVILLEEMVATISAPSNRTPLS